MASSVGEPSRNAEIASVVERTRASGCIDPDLHLVRGMKVPAHAREAIRAKGVDAAFGEHLFGYVKDDYRLPDPANAINVTAK